MLARERFLAYMKEHDLKPGTNYLPMFGQGIIFASMFFALKGMATAPVESMKSQGILWFVDLTAQDPLFLLPVITSLSVFLHLKTGADGVSADQMPKPIRNFMLALPFISCPFMCFFPTVSCVH